MGRLSCVLAVWLLAACETPQAVQDEVSCTTLCRCLTQLPGQQDECVTDCVGDLGPVSDECAQCVYEHADRCTSLFDDCLATCFAQPQP